MASGVESLLRHVSWPTSEANELEMDSTSEIKIGDYFLYGVVILLLLLPYLCKRMNAVIFYSKYIVYTVSSTLFAFGCIPLFALNAKNVKNILYVSEIIKYFRYLVGIKYELRDLDHLSKDRGAIIISNHQSIFDVSGMYCYWHIMKKCTVIAKKEIFYFWPFGLAAWLGGVVFIDRSSKSQSYDVLYKAAEIMQQQKTKIFIFPEGTRNSRANRTLKLLPFKRGAFKIAITSQVPILPIVYSPYYFIDSPTMYFGSGKVIVKGLPEISTENLTESDIDSLMEKTWNAMHKTLITIECRLDSRLYRLMSLLCFWNHSQVLGSVRYYIARIIFYSILILSGVACIPVFLFSPRNLRNSTCYAKYIGKHISHLYGITWDIRGRCYLGERGGAVVIANHQHELDIVGMFTLWPLMDKCAAIAKEELLLSPFGLAAWLAGVVFINRKNTQSAKGRINKTSKILRRNMKIFMFPEGTRNKCVNNTKKLLPFKKGAFRIAIRAQVPIIPVVFSPYYFIDEQEKILDRVGKVVISVLPPVPTSGLDMKDMEKLLHFIWEQMQSEYEALQDEVTRANYFGCVAFNAVYVIKREISAFNKFPVAKILPKPNAEMIVAIFYTFLAVAAVAFAIQYRRSSTFRYYVKFSYFITHSAFMAAVFIPLMCFRPRSWKNAILPAAGLRLIKRILGIRWRIRGLENIEHNSGAIVLINHQSILDLLVLAELWKIMDRCMVISKKEILYMGPFGLAAWLWGTIFIDRLNPDQAKGTINRTGESVKQRKAKLLMFPEGTRHGGPELLNFKKGAFHVAVASHVPIQPVVVSRYFFLNHEEKTFRRGESIIEFLPPIETDEYRGATIDELIDKTYQIMSQRYLELNREMRSGARGENRSVANAGESWNF